MRLTAEAAGEKGARPRRYQPIPLEAIAPAMVEAAVTAEDARFWSHAGIDWYEVRQALGYRRGGFQWSSRQDREALWRALGAIPTRKEALRGASTITQQVAKNLYLSSSRNPLRKLKEAVIAYRLELALPKRRILELYLNIAELGDGVWGVEAASRRYYRKPARRLTQPQAAALAATLPFPQSSNPAYRPVRMRKRQQLILRRMRGERIEVPQLPEEPIPEPGDSIMWTPGIDSLMDSLRAPVETLSAIGYQPSEVPDKAPQSRLGTSDSR
jgi:monofunctional glycosyltransferase